MAQSLETLRSGILTHVYGRRLGLQFDETIVGPKDIKRAVQEFTSASSAQTVNNYGMVVARMSGSITTATQPQLLLGNPIPGVAVDLAYALTSYGATAGSTAVAFQRGTTAFTIHSSNTSTGIGVLLAQGQSVRLLGMTTDIYLAQGPLGTTAVLSPSITVTS